MRDKLIQHVRRDIVLNSAVRYGLARNMPATDEQGRDVLLCMAVIERDNGSFELHAIPEEKIRFHGPQIIEEEILQRMYA